MSEATEKLINDLKKAAGDLNRGIASYNLSGIIAGLQGPFDKAAKPETLKELINNLKESASGASRTDLSRPMTTDYMAQLVSSKQGASGSGATLSQFVSALNRIMTLDPGDYVNKGRGISIAAPVATDLWYLFYHFNMLADYYTEEVVDYTEYLNENLQFLENLPGLKPLRILRSAGDLEVVTNGTFVEPYVFKNQYTNNGVYWVNSLYWELIHPGVSLQDYSAGPKEFDVNSYVGYIAFPVGQLGVMELITMVQETLLSGYKFSGGESPSSSGYVEKPAASPDSDMAPQSQVPGEMFPPVPANLGKCYGLHLVDSAGYYVEKTSTEFLATKVNYWGTDIAPKKWMRHWIHRESTYPVPGEFIGILCKPLVTPPHLWWFQESSPFLYAGGWVETGELTSGVITEVILEENRTDGGTVGNLYFVKIQGCEVAVESTDFFTYAVGERVVIVKIDELTETVADESTTVENMFLFTEANKLDNLNNYVIVPLSFYLK